MEKIAFVMQLREGNEAEYERRHDAIWPALEERLKAAGIHDYSIFLEPSTRQLFAVLRRTDEHDMDQLPSDPIVREWWEYMADLMETNEDKSPVQVPLRQVFHLE